MLRLPVVSPCDVPWEEMTPTREGRRCAACDRDVLDFSAMTETRARAIALLFQGRRLCGRVAHDGDGEAVFRPESVGRAVGSVGSVGGAAGARVAAVAAVLAATSGCGTAPPPVMEAGPPPRAPAVAAAEVAVVTEPRPVDSDGDGVFDKDDACPYQGGEPSEDPSKNGCRTWVGIVVQTGDLQIVQHVEFAAGKVEPLAQSMAVLTEVAEVLKQHSEIKKVRIAGHAASDEKNAKKLSEKRAKAVVAVLVKGGVDAGRLEAVGLGADKPLAEGSTPEGRAQNRRVDFEIVESEACEPGEKTGASGAGSL